MVTPPLAEAMRRMHPLRLSYEMFGPRNPWLAWVDAAAERVRATRRPSEAGNPLLAAQAALSQQIVDGFEAYRRGVERLSEDTFHAVYGTPALQAALGIDTESTQPPRKAPRSELHKALVERRTEQLEAAMTEGGLPEALVRALLWVGMARHAVDERGFAAITRLRDAHEANRQMTLAEFKALVRDQYQMLMIDEEAALARHPGAPARRGRGAPRGLRHHPRHHRGERRARRRPGGPAAARLRALRPRPGAGDARPGARRPKGVLTVSRRARRLEVRAPDRRRPRRHAGGDRRRPSLRRDLAPRRHRRRRRRAHRPGARRPGGEDPRRRRRARHRPRRPPASSTRPHSHAAAAWRWR